MLRADIETKVLQHLEIYCFDNPKRIKKEIKTYGDAEVKSLFFAEIAPYLEIELGVDISPRLIHKNVKSSFMEFCNLLESLVAKRGV